MEEIWKDVVGYEGIYQVSNLGRIKTLNYYGKTNREEIMKFSKRKDGYLGVHLSKNGKALTKTVHRIVATAFIPNPDNLEMVNHKDENRANNCVDNLEWCSRSYNQTYSIDKHPKRKKVFGDNFIKNGENTSPFTKKGIPHKYNVPVVQKNENGEIIKQYNNAAEAGYINGYNSGNIIIACTKNKDKTRKRKNTVSGYIWEFVEQT